MKKTVTVEINECDFCHKESCHRKCFVCGKDVCYDCKKVQGIECQVDLYSGVAGFYCRVCWEQDQSPLRYAFAAIQALGNEQRGWLEDFEKRRKIAADYAKRLLEWWEKEQPRG